MTKVLILNHQHVECGVYQIALRIFNIASLSNNVDYKYSIVSSKEDYVKALADHNPDYVIYNWHWDRMPWLENSDILNNTKVKHFFIYHDGSMMKVYDRYLVFGAMPPAGVKFTDNKVTLLPRPLYTYDGSYRINSIPTIGSFGFAFNHKKFHTVAQYVGSQFNEANVNLHITNPYFGDTPGNVLADIVSLCHRSCPANVKLNINTDFSGDKYVLDFLAGNDLNLFLYDVSLQNPGISSATDYALSVKRPIAVSNNMMFRHIISDSILVEKTPLSSIMRNGTAPLESFYRDWSPTKLREEMDKLFI